MSASLSAVESYRGHACAPFALGLLHSPRGDFSHGNQLAYTERCLRIQQMTKHERGFIQVKSTTLSRLLKTEYKAEKVYQGDHYMDQGMYRDAFVRRNPKGLYFLCVFYDELTTHCQVAYNGQVHDNFSATGITYEDWFNMRGNIRLYSAWKINHLKYRCDGAGNVYDDYGNLTSRAGEMWDINAI